MSDRANRKEARLPAFLLAVFIIVAVALGMSVPARAGRR
jgi:hypothetical protein